MIVRVDKNAKITGTRDFNDLVIDRILFETDEVAAAILGYMFPDAEIEVIVVRDGTTQINVDDVKVKLAPAPSDK